MRAVELSYEEMTTMSSGAIMSKQTKTDLRKQLGYCVTCPLVPVQLYTMQKSRLNPLWVSKKPLAVDGECSNGTCLKCESAREESTRRQRRRQSMSTLSSFQSSQSMSSTSSGSCRSSLQRDHVANTETVSCQFVRVERRKSLSASNSTFTHPPSTYADQVETTAHLQNPPMRATRRQSLSALSMSGNSLQWDHIDSTRDIQGPPMRDQRRQSLSAACISSNSIQPSQGDQTNGMQNVEYPPMRARRRQSMSALTQSTAERDAPSRGVHSANIDKQRSVAPSFVPPAGAGSMKRRKSRRYPSRGCSENNPRSIHESSRSLDHLAGGSLHRTLSSSSSISSCSSLLSEPDTNVLSSDFLNMLHSETADTIHDDPLPQVKRMLAEVQATNCRELVAESVLSAMKTHSAHEPIQQLCMQTMIDGSARGGTLDASRFVLAMGDLLVAGAMENFPAMLSIQRQGCRVYEILAANEGNRRALVERGSCNVLVKALERHVTDTMLVSRVLAAMRMLSTSFDAKQHFNARHISTAVTEAMSCNIESSSIQCDGCAILSNMAVDSRNKVVATVSSKELQAVAAAIKYHARIGEVVDSGCFALKNFSYNETNLREMSRRSDVLEALEQASRIDSVYVIYAHIIERIQISLAQDESLSIG